MKGTCCFILLITITSLGLLSSFVNSQTDSCSLNLNLNAVVPFNTSSLHCLAAWDAEGFILRIIYGKFLQYEQSSSNVWSFVLSAPGDTNSYIAIGFSSNGKMVGSSAVVGWSSNGTGVVKQYYLGGTSPRLVEPDKGNLELLPNSSSIIAQSSRLYLTFQLETNLPLSRLIYSVGPDGIFPAAPNYILRQHRNKVSTSVNYNTGRTVLQTPYKTLRRSHGILNMLGWGILLIIGTIIARHLKQWDPVWFYLHAVIQSLGFGVGLAGVICGFILNDKLDADVSAHKGLGISILVLGCLQVMALLARPDKESKIRKYWNWYHHTLGRILIIFVVANIFYGIHLGESGKGWAAGYAAVVTIMFVVALLLELKMWCRK
ncbi:hypothetical protein FEM48_Zijuj09G0147600 [Ziziphus jujuba var. spinosa]|uniref:Cytochrome b561 and DOMON domain-containing protein At3g07570-like n=1 Tax=Ziziphus jujuba var. spinosa TaxID=714518 RepID=A0A978UTL2_ZIZJJ|nr:hypothetical protein FEM48_Zijuj09G0147600 [Ziziphus jujuba var. spinosa]